MAKITYLLGAGASCGALPMVSNMSEKIAEAINWLQSAYREFLILNRYSTIDQNKFHDILRDLAWLRDLCNTSKNFSIDTYAKKLVLSEQEDDYRKLKNILSFYFTLDQKRNPPDVRYDNFWASILNHKSHFPDDIKIISWNYDFQFELTFKEFINIDSLKAAREELNISSLELMDNSIQMDFPQKFGIFKLNGSATFNSNRENGCNYLIDEFGEIKIDEFIIQLVDTYKKLSTNKFYKNHLSFAWEHDLNSPFYRYLKSAVCNTEILVVIGYSFPFFNRDVDKLIFNKYMGDSLYKVYFQAPDAEDLRERFLAINNRIEPNNLVLRKDIKQFTLPNEL